MFFDRNDAGKQLAQKLTSYTDDDTVVYALPRGGVPVGMEIAKELGAPLDIVITRKIRHPLNMEYAICAISEAGERVCDEIGLCGIDKSWIECESEIQKEEARRRRLVYKDGQLSIPAENKVAIIVDDGIATGLTIKVAIRAIQKQKPEKIIISAPVVPHDVVTTLEELVDEVIILELEQKYQGSLSAYYTHYPEVFDKEVQVALSHIQTMYNERATV